MPRQKKLHKIIEPKKPCFLLFWKKPRKVESTLCGRSIEDVFYTTDNMAITCRSCRKIMSKLG